jgi:branched-chain amino acid transport system substrate-binding protein
VSDWITADADVIDPLIAEDSAAFAAESGIAERCN